MSRDREGISNSNDCHHKSCFANILQETGLSEICQKTQSPDVDHRYMALNDLLGYLESGISPLEDAASQKLTEVLLKCLEDTNGEVQNVSVKWYALDKTREDLNQKFRSIDTAQQGTECADSYRQTL